MLPCMVITARPSPIPPVRIEHINRFGSHHTDCIITDNDEAAERFIMGLPEAKTVNGVSVLAYGDNANPPYVGIGFLARYMQDGVTSYTPIVLTKARFSQPSTNANTQEDAIDWQTQELEAAILRDDTAKHDWKYVGGELASEEAAEAKIKSVFNIT